MATSTIPRERDRRPQSKKLQRLNILDGLEEPKLEALQKPEQVEARASETPPVADRPAMTITNVQYIGSYNWLDHPEPTIVVPGSPRVWQDRDLPFQVPPDSGTLCTHEDRSRVPSYPMLPWFRAVETISSHENAAIDWSGVDFVTNRNSLRKLLRWTKEPKLDDFRIDTQLAGENTVILSQWVDRLWMKTDSRYPGYGRNFEHESTSPVTELEHLPTTGGHFRIIKYDLGGLAMVLCFEVDAYVASANSTMSRTSTDGDANLSPSASASVSAPRVPTKDTDPKQYVDVIHAGHQVSQADLVEIKTGKRVKWKETYPQLFLSQTPHLFTASHEQGKFHRIQKLAVDGPEMRGLVDEFQTDFAKLRETLIAIRETLRRHKQHLRLSLVCRKGKLDVFRMRDTSSCLPDAELQRFEIPPL
ncbi:hypothetical protein DAEQUDRAFT_726559 [Daedalea quercina L-15889]|uniref:Geranylgeranyl pyrophosphate synthetase n=1 Tax=Daedalea quercina L-15889 TaxID=1314783 RepID=A0A165QK06_9APHY|nr:hypothetical protein DAEQUDRAFT_726559 [Daedalea quercina L-15889]